MSVSHFTLNQEYNTDSGERIKRDISTTLPINREDVPPRTPPKRGALYNLRSPEVTPVRRACAYLGRRSGLLDVAYRRASLRHEPLTF